MVPPTSEELAVTAPTPTAPSPPPAAAPGPPTPRRYLVTWVGAVLGMLVIGGAGAAIGFGFMDLYHDPDAGLANLALLLFPLAFGGIGVLAGAFLGTRVALRRDGDALATRTAMVMLALAFLTVFLVGATNGLGLPLLLAAPVAARWLVMQDTPTG